MYSTIFTYFMVAIPFLQYTNIDMVYTVDS